MNRRGFFKRLAGAVAGIVFVAKATASLACVTYNGIEVPKSQVILSTRTTSNFGLDKHGRSVIRHAGEIVFGKGSTLSEESILIPPLDNGFKRTLNTKIDHWNRSIEWEAFDTEMFFV